MKPYILIGVLLGLVGLSWGGPLAAAHEAGRENWMWAWVVCAGVYNPLFKVAASREVWTVVNLVTLAVVGYGCWAFRTTGGDVSREK